LASKFDGPENHLFAAQVRQETGWFRNAGTWLVKGLSCASTASCWRPQGETVRSQLSASLSIKASPRFGTLKKGDVEGRFGDFGRSHY